MTQPKQTYPTDLNNSEWKRIEQYLPPHAPKGPGGRPREITWRRILNGIFYTNRSAAVGECFRMICRIGR